MFRRTPRWPRKSYSHCVLPRSPGSENSRVRSNVWTFSPSDILKAVSGQSFSFQSITDSPTQRQSSISFHFNDLRTLFIATEGYAPSVPIWNSSPSIITRPRPFFSCTYRNPFCNPFPFIFIQEWGVGGPNPDSVGTPDIQTLGRSDVRRISVRPIAAHTFWCHNPQRHEISLRYRETTPLLPVSKTTRADNGTSS